MPRRPRLILPELPLHLIQRGNNRQTCFSKESDYLVYLEWLAEYAIANAVRLHAYVLMSNHVHLLLTAGDGTSVAGLMKAIGQRYAQYYNRHHDRSGSLWVGRYRSCLVQDEAYFLTCQRYIELNPVRAGMVEHPAAYRWSSYRANAHGGRTKLQPHPVYLALGATAEARQSAYRALFETKLDARKLAAIRSATSGNTVLGDNEFAVRRPGRPRKRC